MTHQPLLIVNDVHRYFGATTAVAGLSFQVAPGETVGLLGPNGSGKSSTMFMLTGLLEPSSGVIEINGMKPSKAEAKRSIGFVPDDLPLPDSLTGSEFLALHDRLRDRSTTHVTAEFADIIGIASDLDRPIVGYSHGMKRKLQIVASFRHRPALIVMDEPHRGLDPEAAGVLRALTDAHTRSGGATLIATHDLRRAETECDRVVIVHEGVLVATGSPSEIHALTNDTDLESSFMSLTGLDSRLDDARSRLNRLSSLEAT